MRTRVSKWGNSLAVRIPAALAEDAQVCGGDLVDVDVIDGKLVIAPARRGVPTLEELLDKLDPATLHGEVDWGPRVGNEVW